MLPPLRFLGFSALLGCVFYISWNASGAAPRLTAAPLAPPERCPNEPYQKPDGSWAHAGGEDSVPIPLAGKIQRIPEYHDCQRLLDRDLQYGPLIGVWSRDELRGVPDSHYSRPNGVAVAELYNFSPQSYGFLGILGTGYACLYLKRDLSKRGFTATMVYLHSRADCPARFDPKQVRSKTLEVKVQKNSRGLAPSAARWDMDPKTNIQYIGVWCPDGWCEVGIPGFSSSVEYPDSPGSPQERVKGWYDEQYLSIYDSATKKMRPSRILGRTIPVAGLDTMTLAYFRCDSCGTQHWRHTATAIIDRDVRNFYGRKLNLQAGVRSKIYLRHNLRNDAWEALIVRAGAKSGVIRRVIRVDHSNIRVPGTSRWHFVEDDETVWVRCSDGCCDVSGLQ